MPIEASAPLTGRSTPIFTVPDVAPLEDDDELVELELLQAARSAARTMTAVRETRVGRIDDSWTASESGLSTPAVTGRPAPERPARLLPAEPRYRPPTKRPGLHRPYGSKFCLRARISANDGGDGPHASTVPRAASGIAAMTTLPAPRVSAATRSRRPSIPFEAGASAWACSATPSSG